MNGGWIKMDQRMELTYLFFFVIIRWIVTRHGLHVTASNSSFHSFDIPRIFIFILAHLNKFTTYTIPSFLITSTRHFQRCAFEFHFNGFLQRTEWCAHNACMIPFWHCSQENEFMIVLTIPNNNIGDESSTHNAAHSKNEDGGDGDKNDDNNNDTHIDRFC